ncbi:carbohydrate kinase, partial [bacterium]|nr:carbohydrate kinase [bacterium]
MPKYLLGTDNGCTMSKAALFTLDGKEVAVASRKTETLTPRPGFLERNVPEMWKSTADAIREVITSSGIDPADIACVAPTGHGNGLYLIDDVGEPVCDAILSTDSRARDIIDRWTADGVDKAVRPKT